MKSAVTLGVVVAAFSCAAFARNTQPPTRLLTKVTALPVALDPDFQFRKTKLYFLSEHNTMLNNQKTKSKTNSDSGDNANQQSTARDAARSKSGASVQDASINFEREYRLFGAVTKLDEHERFGDYLDFYWRAKRPANLTVRLEYQQEKLHAHVQAQEVSYENVQGTVNTEFKVIGDDYFDNGRIIAWRCLLVENGRVVAENRSFLWR